MCLSGAEKFAIFKLTTMLGNSDASGEQSSVMSKHFYVYKLIEIDRRKEPWQKLPNTINLR